MIEIQGGNYEIMKIEDIAAYWAKGRIIDLFKKVEPGKAEGPLSPWGVKDRKIA
jgi:hypothetical protein